MARLQTHTICSLNNFSYNVSYYICRKIISHWQPLFSKKIATAASFSYKIGGSVLIFLQNWRRRPHFPTKLAAAASFSYKIGGGVKDLAILLAAVLTWCGYWCFWRIFQFGWCISDEPGAILFYLV